MRKTQNGRQLSLLLCPHHRPSTWEWKFQRLLSYEYIICLFYFKYVSLPSCFFRLIKYYFVHSSELSTKRQFHHQSILRGLKLWTSPYQPNRFIYELWIRKLCLFLCICVNSVSYCFSLNRLVLQSTSGRQIRTHSKMDHQMFWIVWVLNIPDNLLMTDLDIERYLLKTLILNYMPNKWSVNQEFSVTVIHYVQTDHYIPA